MLDQAAAGGTERRLPLARVGFAAVLVLTVGLFVFGVPVPPRR